MFMSFMWNNQSMEIIVYLNIRTYIMMSLNDSVENTKAIESVTGINFKNQLTDEVTVCPQAIDHKRYGRMLVLLQTERVLITLGPDYLFFIITFICIFIAGFFLTYIVNQVFQNLLVKIGNFLIVGIQLMSYLLVAVSNPGIVLQQNLTSDQNGNQGDKKYCSICRLQVSKDVYHCTRCDVCIYEYDHHCPWTSKCIGGSNLKRFWFFMGITPCYIVYYMIMIFVCFAVYSINNSTSINVNVVQ